MPILVRTNGNGDQGIRNKKKIQPRHDTFTFFKLTNAQEGEEVATAIKDFVPPDSHEIIPTPARSSSNIYKYGLKLKNRASGKWCFACLGSPFCREQSGKGIFIAIGPKAASNANDHITARHKAGELLLPSSLETKHRRPLCAGYRNNNNNNNNYIIVACSAGRIFFLESDVLLCSMFCVLSSAAPFRRTPCGPKF